MFCCMLWSVRAVERLEGCGYLFTEVKVLSATKHEIMLSVLLDPLTLVGHE